MLLKKSLRTYLSGLIKMEMVKYVMRICNKLWDKKLIQEINSFLGKKLEREEILLVSLGGAVKLILLIRSLCIVRCIKKLLENSV